jgi:hypothetical protein
MIESVLFDLLPISGEWQVDIGTAILLFAGERCLSFQRRLRSVTFLSFFSREMFVIGVEIEDRPCPFI